MRRAAARRDEHALFVRLMPPRLSHSTAVHAYRSCGLRRSPDAPLSAHSAAVVAAGEATAAAAHSEAPRHASSQGVDDDSTTVDGNGMAKLCHVSARVQ